MASRRRSGRDYSTGTRARMEISCGGDNGPPWKPHQHISSCVGRRRLSSTAGLGKESSTVPFVLYSDFSRIKKGTSTKWSAFGFTVVIFCIRYMALLCPYKLRIHSLSTRSIFRCSCLLLYVPGVSRCI